MKMQIVSYDIPDDSLRQKIAETLKNYGFIRIQYSVFNGIVPKSKMKDVVRELEDLIQNDKGDVIILEMCESCQKNMMTVYSEPNDEKAEEQEPNTDIIQKKTKEPENQKSKGHATSKKQEPPEKGRGVIVL